MSKKILITEDDSILRDILANKLSQEGFTTLTAADGEEALALLRSEKPDLMLLDILIPKKNGFEVLKEMRADTALSGIPVIAISNSGEQKEVAQAQELGATDFLVKAIFDSNDVVKKVEEALGHSTAAGRPSRVMEGTPQPSSTPAPTPAPAPTPTPSATGGGGSGRAVMIVEDDKFLRELAAQKLRAEGFTVYEATSGDEAFAVLKDHTPNIVILDVILPGMSGFEILAKIKENAAWKNIPVIMLSNLGQEEDIEKAKTLGANDYLVKAHFSFGEIIKKIRTVLGE